MGFVPGFHLLQLICQKVHFRNCRLNFTILFLVVNPGDPVVMAGRRKEYIRCCYLCWGIPIVVVGICVALQLTAIGNVGYGELTGAYKLELHNEYMKVLDV